MKLPKSDAMSTASALHELRARIEVATSLGPDHVVTLSQSAAQSVADALTSTHAAHSPVARKAHYPSRRLESARPDAAFYRELWSLAMMRATAAESELQRLHRSRRVKIASRARRNTSELDERTDRGASINTMTPEAGANTPTRDAA